MFDVYTVFLNDTVYYVVRMWGAPTLSYCGFQVQFFLINYRSKGLWRFQKFML